MSVKLLQGDCLELLKQVKDESIDLVLADLPYGMTANKWDSVIPLVPLLNSTNGLLSHMVLFFYLAWVSLALS